MAKKTEFKKRLDVAKKKLLEDTFIGNEAKKNLHEDSLEGAEWGQEIKLKNLEKSHLYGEYVMQFHVKADNDHFEGMVSGIEVSSPRDGNGQPWRPIVCKWYVEKGPVDVEGKKAGDVKGGGTIQWKPYNPS